MKIRSIFTLLILTLLVSYSRAQDIAIKTNLLYGGYTYTPNLSLEIGLGKRSTLDLGGGYNPWNLDGTAENNKKLVQRFSGHFLGVHVLGSQYNIAQQDLPLIFGKGSKEYRFEGYGYGGGISYGYNFFLGIRWSIEANLGIGYARLHYDKYKCQKCGEKIGTESRNYFGPTKAGISLIYYLK